MMEFLLYALGVIAYLGVGAGMGTVVGDKLEDEWNKEAAVTAFFFTVALWPCTIVAIISYRISKRFI